MQLTCSQGWIQRASLGLENPIKFCKIIRKSSCSMHHVITVRVMWVGQMAEDTLVLGVVEFHITKESMTLMNF